MKIIKFKKKEKFKYKRKVIIKDLILNIFIGIHNFEKKNRQRVKFNIEIFSIKFLILTFLLYLYFFLSLNLIIFILLHLLYQVLTTQVSGRYQHLLFLLLYCHFL